MTCTLKFRVYGVPKPAGSKKAFVNKKTRQPIIVDDCKRSKEWKHDVRDAAFDVAPTTPINAPITLDVTFIMPRPKYHYRTGKHAGELKPNAPEKHTKKPDRTKLLRGTEDALTKLLWADDSLVWSGKTEKVYGDRPGAEITIEWEEEE